MRSAARAPAAGARRRRAHRAQSRRASDPPAPAGIAADGVFGPQTGGQALPALARARGRRDRGPATWAALGAPASASCSSAAAAPARPPARVRRIIAAGDRIADKPYKYGGGPAVGGQATTARAPSPTPARRGVALERAHLRRLHVLGRPGPGRWVTIYASPATSTWWWRAAVRHDGPERVRHALAARALGGRLRRAPPARSLNVAVRTRKVSLTARLSGGSRFRMQTYSTPTRNGPSRPAALRAPTRPREGHSRPRGRRRSRPSRRPARRRGALRSQVDQRSTEAGQTVGGLASDVRSVGEQLREQGKDQPAKLAEQAADRAERLGGYLKQSDADRILGDVEDFGRRQPWAVIAGGLALGLVASRFLKASSQPPLRAALDLPQLPVRPTARPARPGTTGRATTPPAYDGRPARPARRRPSPRPAPLRGGR